MTIYPACSATEEEGPYFAPILSNHILPVGNARLRESGRRMSTIKKIARETSGFHMEAARRHGVDTARGLAHFRAAKAYREADSKLMEFFDSQGQQPGHGASQLDPKAQCDAHGEAVKFHKKMAEKHGLDSDQGHAHVALMEKHMDAIRGLKQNAKQQKQQKPAAQGPAGRQQPQMPIPHKSQMKNPDIRQNKPPIMLKQKASGGKNENYVAQRYDQSHPEGFKKDYEAEEGGTGSGPQGGKSSGGEKKSTWGKHKGVGDHVQVHPQSDGGGGHGVITSVSGKNVGVHFRGQGVFSVPSSMVRSSGKGKVGVPKGWEGV